MTRTTPQLEDEIRRLNTGEHLGPVEARRLQTAVDELSALTGARVTVTGQCISLDVTRNQPAQRRPVRSTKPWPVTMTYCKGCRTTGIPGQRCRCALTPKAPARHYTWPELRERAHRMLDREALENPERLMALSRGQVRDLALRKIEKRSNTLTPAQQDQVDSLVRTESAATDGKLVARRIAATDPDAYASGSAKGLSQKKPAFTPEEARAINIFREVQVAEMRAASETGSFGFGLQWFVDPTIIYTTQDTAEIGAAARIVTITTNAWHGISTPGVTSGFTAENTVVADGSPTFAAETVPVYADKFYVPASLELTQDYVGWLGEVTNLMIHQWAADVSQYCTVGTGVGQPTGIVYRMAGITQSPSHCVATTAGQLGAVDLRAAWSALPERYHAGASWYCSPSMVSRISSQAAATVTNGLGSSEWTFDPGTGIPRLFGRPVLQSSFCDSFTGTTGTCNYAVVGDFSRFIIAHRSGLDVEMVSGSPAFPASNRPTGSIGIFGMSRFGSDVVDVNAFRVIAAS
jgi:HK97 family phage major capsid protein